MPEHVRPMLARLGQLPEGDDSDWGFEIKWDGVRALAYLQKGKASFESRSLERISHRYPELRSLAEALAPHDCLLDGEIVALDEDGRPSFQLLQSRMGVSSTETIARRAAESPVTYMAFDLLHLDGASTMPLPYSERRELLAGLDIAGPNWQAPRHHVGEGRALLEMARRQSLEGIVGKLLASPYRAGSRSGEWIKVRNRPRQEFVIGGWTPGEGSRHGSFGALLLGYFDASREEAQRRGEPQRFLFAGGVGTGFTDSELARLTPLLHERERTTNPFEPAIGGPKRRDSRFCEPDLVCEVEYTEWTRENTLRQASYKGLRDDKDARDVIREG
ncbi:MAG: bifunctional non-ous end joining protein LigD [Solirubrobacterales bacterium]|nr:bifunctional non-ous end joining protein LigD [Solirubrobacterales bacterium]